jgi:hypothetical protein
MILPAVSLGGAVEVDADGPVLVVLLLRAVVARAAAVGCSFLARSKALRCDLGILVATTTEIVDAGGITTGGVIVNPWSSLPLSSKDSSGCAVARDNDPCIFTTRWCVLWRHDKAVRLVDTGGWSTKLQAMQQPPSRGMRSRLQQPTKRNNAAAAAAAAAAAVTRRRLL